MNRILPGAIVAVCLSLLTSSPSLAGCRPDRQWVDNITKQRNVQFNHDLNRMGFWKSMVASDVELWVIVLRLGQINAINVQVTKVENDRDRAAFESQFRGAKGDRFTFGFKGGQPLSFVAAEVNNQSKIVQGKGLVMTVVLSAHVSDSEMARFRETLTSKEIDAIRVNMTTGQFDRVVDEENGEAMMEKFGCFYSWLDENGVVLPDAAAIAARSSDVPNSVQGRYRRRGKPGDFLDLSNGTFVGSQEGHALEGSYTVQGDVITLSSPKMPRPANGRISGATIVDEDGLVWERQSETATDGRQPATTLEDRLKKLDDLRKKGLITEEEYQKKRAEILEEL